MFSFHVRSASGKTPGNLIDSDCEIVCLFIFDADKTRAMSYFLLAL